MDEREPDNADERSQRAGDLRREIERITEGKRRPKSPHEFIEERMREEHERGAQEELEAEGGPPEDREGGS